MSAQTLAGADLVELWCAHRAVLSRTEPLFVRDVFRSRPDPRLSRLGARRAALEPDASGHAPGDALAAGRRILDLLAT